MGIEIVAFGLLIYASVAVIVGVRVAYGILKTGDDAAGGCVPFAIIAGLGWPLLMVRGRL